MKKSNIIHHQKYFIISSLYRSHLFYDYQDHGIIANPEKSMNQPGVQTCKRFLQTNGLRMM
jgi:hypothetical protein